MTTSLASLADEVDLLMSPGDPHRHAIRQNPYPLYRRLREQAPAFHHERTNTWIFSRFADCHQALRSPDLTTDIVERWRVAAGDTPLVIRPAQKFISNGMFWRDPPEHTRLRVLVQGAFRPSAINRLMPRVDEIAAELLAELAGRNRFDLLYDFAHRLPARVITEMIGMPLDMMARYSEWAQALVGVQEPGVSEERLQHYDRMAEECLEYLDGLMAEKRRNPGEDIISHLLECSDREDLNVTLDEVLGLVMILNAGGQETTANAICNGMVALMRHPEQYRRLRADHTLLPSAVAEIIRYDTPARLLNRYVKNPTQIGGADLEPGAIVFGILGSAHHDEAVFDDPGAFDITRDGAKAMWFGFGPHYCIGARLAWVETEAAVRQLLLAYPDGLEPANDELRWRDSLMIRGLESLPVAVA